MHFIQEAFFTAMWIVNLSSSMACFNGQYALHWCHIMDIFGWPLPWRRQWPLPPVLGTVRLQFGLWKSGQLAIRPCFKDSNLCMDLVQSLRHCSVLLLFMEQRMWPLTMKRLLRSFELNRWQSHLRSMESFKYAVSWKAFISNIWKWPIFLLSSSHSISYHVLCVSI